MVNEVNIPSLRNYEVSIWTLQDRFLSVLKWFNLEQKGQIQQPQIILKDDGTQTFTFSIPKFYRIGNNLILNPMWHKIEDEQPIIANMHKLKVIFNKNIGQQYIEDLDQFIINFKKEFQNQFGYFPNKYGRSYFEGKTIDTIVKTLYEEARDSNKITELSRVIRQLNLEETILEFLVVSVTESHTEDNIIINISAEGLAFHELGKLGYKISLSQDDFLNDQEAWFKGSVDNINPPQEDIHYWNKKIFGSNDNLITNWTYRVDMDWSSYSNSLSRLNNQVYEDEYVSSWQVQDSQMMARYVEGLRVKWRSIDVKESNIYNITQTIAETFGVFCRYEYEHDANYQITGRTVVYYNNYNQERMNHFDLTYPYSSSSIERVTDSSNIITKLYVRAVDNDSQGAETITIMDVDANKSKEDYLLNFDYLYKIGTITEEQYNEVSDYELKLHMINENLYNLKERINIIESQLTAWEAKQKTASDAVLLDKERQQAAEDAKSALTDDNGEIPYEKTFAAIPASDRENYYYISAPVKGIRENSIHIYEEYDMKNKMPNQNSEIFGFIVIRDEFGEVSKIGFANTKDMRTGWLVCKFNPYLYYDKVIQTWKQRAILDQQNYDNASKEIRKLNYWLYGNINQSYANDDFYNVTEYDTPAYCDSFTTNQNPDKQIESKVDECRIVSQDTPINEFTGIVDINSVLKKLLSPNLYDNYQECLQHKTDIINAFDRMMGPALREGYWQPENYNDYGDVYNTVITLQNNIPSPSTSGHVSFLWDWKKQYDNENSLVYQSAILGKTEQYIAINLQSILGQIADHTKDLTFFYYDLGVIQTIYEVQERINQLYPELYTFGENGFDTAALLQFFNICDNINIGSYFIDNENNIYINEILKLKGTSSTIKKIIDNNDIESNEKNKQINNIINHISTVQINNIVTGINDLFDRIMRKINFNNSLLDMYTHSPHSSDSSNEQEYLNQENNNLQTLYSNLSNLLHNYIMVIINKRKEAHADNQFEWIESLINKGYRTFTVGSQCELGWIIDANESASFDANGNFISSPIPVLILTEAKNLDEKTIKYLATGTFDYEWYEGDEVNGIVYHTSEIKLSKVMQEYSPFLGYYDVTRDNNIVTNITPVLITRIEYDTTKQSNYPYIIYEDIQANENGIYPTFEEYHYRRVYPRLYFDTLKLKNNSDQLHIKFNKNNLTENEDYYTLTDDRSVGITVDGVGYYTTFRPHTLYQNTSYENGQSNLNINILYTLSNADVAIYLDAIAVMRENAAPKVSYEVELSILDPEIIKNAYNCLTQIVSINDIELQLEDVQGYISAITMSLDKPWEDTVEIKNYKTKFEDLFSTIVAQTEAMKKSQMGLDTVISVFSSDGLIKSSVIENSMRHVNLQQAYYGGKLTISEENGIVATADNNAGVVVMRGSGIFTATEKDANGEWKWNTGILPSGINANLITTGQLDTNLIRIYSGDDLSFQWDGDGLYAYRSIYDNKIINAAYDSSNSNNQQEYITVSDSENSQNYRDQYVKDHDTKLDYKQYVKFDGTGLSLVAEKGVYIPQKSVSADNQITYYYKDTPLNQTVERVKIGWDGLILRNWSGKKTFYADPDTGNLTLTGTIYAEGGTIAGWEIEDNKLSSPGIQFISNASDHDTPGIYLTATEANDTKDYIDFYDQDSGTTIRYYKYSYIDNNGESHTCYSSNGARTFNCSASDKLYEIFRGPIGVRPLYTKDIKVDNKTYTFICNDKYEELTDDTSNWIEYLNNTQVLDDENSWYARLINNNSDYENYIEYIYGYVRTEIQVANDTTMTQVNQTITFQVASQTGEVFINRGSLGNFTIDSQGNIIGIKNDLHGTIDQTGLGLNNYIVADNQEVPLGECIYSCSYDDTSKTLFLKKLNGQVLQFTISIPQAAPSPQPDDGNNSNPNTCNSNCTGECYSSCGSSCNQGCAVGCAYQCGQKCASSCAGCTATCKTACRGNTGGGCFSGNTLITLYNDTVMPISRLVTGMRLKAYNEETQNFTESNIVNIQKFEHKNDIVDLVLSNGDKITSTKSHPVLTTDGWKAVDTAIASEEHYVDVGLLKIGDKLINNCDEDIYIKDIINRIDLNDMIVYNIDVDKFNTYIANNIVVHNADSK